MKRLLIIAAIIALLGGFTTIKANAHPPCEKVWVEGHRDKHGKWIKAHWKHLHWIPSHHNRHGELIPGHCG